MRWQPLVLLIVVFAACKKEGSDNQVGIYLLQSFTRAVDTNYYPAVTIVKNPVLETQALVANNEITGYDQSTNTFRLTTNIYERVKNLGPDRAFAVVINNELLYCGMIHPGYLSSLRFGIATIDPIFTNEELAIHYVLMAGSNYGFLRRRTNATTQGCLMHCAQQAASGDPLLCNYFPSCFEAALVQLFVLYLYESSKKHRS